MHPNPVDILIDWDDDSAQLWVESIEVSIPVQILATTTTDTAVFEVSAQPWK